MSLISVGDCNGHPAIANGDVHTQPEKTELKVQCALLYKLEGPEIVKCVNGNWSTLPVCLCEYCLCKLTVQYATVDNNSSLLFSMSPAPCKLDQKLFYSVQDDYIAHGAKKRVWCYMNGWIEVKCNNGRTLYKGCTLSFVSLLYYYPQCDLLNSETSVYFLELSF